MALNTYQYPMPSKGATTKLDLWKACIVGVGLNDTVCDNIRDEEYDSYENQVQRYLNDFDVRNRGGEIVWCIHFRKFEFSSRCIMATQTLSPGYWWQFSPGLCLTGIGDNAKIFPQKSPQFFFLIQIWPKTSAHRPPHWLDDMDSTLRRAPGKKKPSQFLAYNDH